MGLLEVMGSEMKLTVLGGEVWGANEKMVGQR